MSWRYVLIAHQLTQYDYRHSYTHRTIIITVIITIGPCHITIVYSVKILLCGLVIQPRLLWETLANLTVLLNLRSDVLQLIFLNVTGHRKKTNNLIVWYPSLCSSALHGSECLAAIQSPCCMYRWVVCKGWGAQGSWHDIGSVTCGVWSNSEHLTLFEVDCRVKKLHYNCIIIVFWLQTLRAFVEHNNHSTMHINEKVHMHGSLWHVLKYVAVVKNVQQFRMCSTAKQCSLADMKLSSLARYLNSG